MLKNEQNFEVEKIQIVVVISMNNVPQKWRRKKIKNHGYRPWEGCLKTDHNRDSLSNFDPI